MEPVIKIENLGKKYQVGKRESYYSLRDKIADLFNYGLSKNGGDDFWALKDVNFEINRGESIGIIGRNGAGKSTLLKILSRITPPTTGKITIKGRVASLLEVGTGFNPELTGRENIFLNGAILGMTRAEIKSKFDEIVEFAEVEKFLDTPVKRYSSGMYMRLAFAVAAHLDSEILIVDEVLAVGDAQFQKKCLGKMNEVTKKDGRTVLFVSHNMNAIEQLCSGCILLDNGKVLMDSKDTRAVTKKYVNGNIGGGKHSKWTRKPGFLVNGYFDPVSISITNKAGKLAEMPVSNSEDFWIEIKADIETLDKMLTVGYAIYSEDNELLYWSYQTDSDEKIWPKLKVGNNIIRSKIPKNFLNEGVYRIELIGGIHYQKWLFEPGTNVPTVTLDIKGGLSTSPYWMIKRPGLMAPVINWESDNNEKNS